jgi:internalin A
LQTASEWVTGGVYKILNNLDLMQNQGKLDRAQLARILTVHDGYPPDRHDFIIGMMRKFELCFDFPDSGGRELLVPELLSKNEPHLGWNTSEAVQFEYHYNVLPEGLIPRFIVKMHRHLTDKPTYWRSGVVLGIEGNIVLIRGDNQAAKVFIAVFGPVSGRREALAVVRNALHDIHATIPKIDAQPKVVLPGEGICLDYNALRAFERKGIRTLPVCRADGRVREVLVDEVLNGVDHSRALRSEPAPAGFESAGATARHSSPWVSGSFYLVALVVAIGAAAVASAFVPWYAVVAVFLMALLGATVVGILQLKNDERIEDKDFVNLLRAFFGRLPLLKLGDKQNDQAADSHASAPVRRVEDLE